MAEKAHPIDSGHVFEGRNQRTYRDPSCDRLERFVRQIETPAHIRLRTRTKLIDEHGNALPRPGRGRQPNRLGRETGGSAGDLSASFQIVADTDSRAMPPEDGVLSRLRTVAEGRHHRHGAARAGPVA